MVVAGIGQGLVRGSQVAVAMNIAETELSHIGPNAVLGALRTLERGGSVVGLIAIAFLSSHIGYAGATGATALWVLVGAALFAGFYAAGGVFGRAQRPREPDNQFTVSANCRIATGGKR